MVTLSATWEPFWPLSTLYLLYVLPMSPAPDLFTPLTPNFSSKNTKCTLLNRVAAAAGEHAHNSLQLE